MPPPRTITDITAVLDKEKPDPKSLAKMKAQADADPPSNLSGVSAARLLYDRGTARLALGRLDEAWMTDKNRCSWPKPTPVRRSVAAIYRHRESSPRRPQGGLQSLSGAESRCEFEHAVGWIFNSSWNGIIGLIAIGDVSQTEGYLRQMTAAITEARTRGNPRVRKSINSRAGLGRRTSKPRAELFWRRVGSIMMQRRPTNRPPTSSELRSSILQVGRPFSGGPGAARCRFRSLDAARMKAKQGRLAEAEADIRQVLLARLKAQGKYNPKTTKFVLGLARVMVDEGRYADAEKLYRAALDIQRTIGIADKVNRPPVRCGSTARS